MTLDEFRTAFQAVRNLGWTRSLRRGPTGVGHTLEQLIGLKENNISLPDLGEIELKAHRTNSASMITLFTFNRKVWKMKPLDAVRAFGTQNINGRLGMYFTMSRNPNGSNLFLQIEEKAISVRHTEGRIIAEWPIEALVKRFIQKFPGLIFVSVSNEYRGNVEWFRFDRAQRLSGTTSDILRQQLDAGNILLDLRLHDKVTSARNHGTGFRIFENKLPLIFANV